jgi:hypothetical protein
MTARPPQSTAACGECGAPLHADQRYCLSCGARHGAPRVDPLGALGFAVETPAGAASGGFAAGAASGSGAAAGGGFAPVGTATSGAAATTISAAPSGGASAGNGAASGDVPSSARRVPSRRLSAALAAATLALGAAAGAALGPGPAPSVAAAPQRLVALVVPSAAPVATTTTDKEPELPEDAGSSDTPSADEDTTSTADDSTSADDDTSTDDTSTDTKTTDADAKTTPAASDDSSSSTTPAATVATVPAHVFVISLTGLDATAFAPTSPLADLVARGTLLSNYSAAGPSAAANELALLGGQVPTADCAADLAACVLPAGETSLPDQLRTINLTWRAYVDDPAQRCAATPSARVGASLFTTLAARKDCASNVVDPATLDADLAKKAKTPALSLFVPSAPADGSAGLDGASAPLHALVAKITASAAYKADGVLLIVSDAPPLATAPVDPATAPPPPAADPTTATAAPLGALVLSPRATAARTVDAATGPVALLRSIEDLLGLDPLGAAAQATPALDGVLAPPTATASASAAPTFPHRSHPLNPTRRSP